MRSRQIPFSYEIFAIKVLPNIHPKPQNVNIVSFCHSSNFLEWQHVIKKALDFDKLIPRQMDMMTPL